MAKYLDLFKQTLREFGQDKAPRLGAALAYYTIFSIAPLLLIAVAVAGFVFGRDAAMGRVSAELKNVFGPITAKAVEEMIQSAAKPKTGTFATIAGIVTLVLGASGVFGQLKDALNTIWNVEPKKSSGAMSFVKNRFLSMAMVLGIGFLLLVSLLFDAVISGMGDYLTRNAGGEALFLTVQQIISFALVTLLFALIFRFLPDMRIAWHDVWFGALFTGALFVLGKFALGLYLGKAAAGSSYGAAGSLVILLLWVYYSAQILFFGAEFTQVYARSYGSLKGDASKEKAKAVAERVEDRPKAQQPVAARSGGGVAKLAAGGVVGLLIGTFVGSLLALKSIKRLLTLPFR